MKVCLIRHSITKGNLKKRYLGTTDEELCQEGIDLLEEKKDEFAKKDVSIVFSSPMKRCLQTAKTLFPKHEIIVIPELSECDFGIFENKNYEELSDCPEYQSWIESNGKDPFPGGESIEDFFERSRRGFEKGLNICKERNLESAAFVAHGGTIMGLMSQSAESGEDPYNYVVKNAGGYEFTFEDGKMTDIHML